MFTGGIGISPRTERDIEVAMNMHNPGLLWTSGFSTGFANDKHTSAVYVQCFCGFGYNLNWCVMIDILLMMPPPLSHYCLEEDSGRDEKVGKYCACPFSVV